MTDQKYDRKDFEEKVSGKMKWTEKQFAGNSGGAADSSLRGFGATEQFWDVPTEGGWTIHYGDNGAGIQGAVSPDGEKYYASTEDAGEWVPEHSYKGMTVDAGWSAIKRIMVKE
jgi:hypothetical protein